jgi:hypothetical protein
MPFPQTVKELQKAGYFFESSRRCIGAHCNKTIEIWRTPSRRKMPLEINAQGGVTVHFSTCPDREKFKEAEAARLQFTLSRSEHMALIDLIAAALRCHCDAKIEVFEDCSQMPVVKTTVGDLLRRANETTVIPRSKDQREFMFDIAE